MEIILLGRGQGKTSILIQKSATSGDTIICHSKEECLRILHKAKEIGLSIANPISYKDYFEGNYDSKIKGFFV